jgi:hypothetical protein
MVSAMSTMQCRSLGSSVPAASAASRRAAAPGAPWKSAGRVARRVRAQMSKGVVGRRRIVLEFESAKEEVAWRIYELDQEPERAGPRGLAGPVQLALASPLTE